MKTAKAAEPTVTHDLAPERTECPRRRHPMWADAAARRTVHTLAGVTRLHRTVRRCRRATYAAFERPYRTEAEGAFALPRYEFGFDVLALVGRLRYAHESSRPRSGSPGATPSGCCSGPSTRAPGTGSW